MKCSQCGTEMEKITYDIGYDIDIESLTCPNCRFNVTEEEKLDKAIDQLRDKMTMKVKVVKIGTGVGIRFPNEIARKLRIRRGAELKVAHGGDKLVISKSY